MYIWTLYVGWAMVMGPFSWSWSWSLWRWLFIMRISGFYASVSGMFSYTYLNIVLKRLHMWSMRGWLAANWNGGPFPFSHFPILSLFPYIPLKHLASLVSKCQYFPPPGKGFLMMWLALWPIKWIRQHFAQCFAMHSIMLRCPLNQSLFVLLYAHSQKGDGW